MRFAAPQLLWLLLVVPALALGAGWGLVRRRRALERFAGGGAALVERATAQVSPHRRMVKLILLLLSFSAAVLALARPQWGTRLEPVTRHGADLVVVLDTSLSMAAEDVAPSRLGQAKHAIGVLLERIPDDRVALLTFAGRATLSCPFTVDHAAVRLFLDAIEPEAVQVPGTALADALRAALSTLGSAEQQGGGERAGAIVLFSDGEDHEGGLEDASSALKRTGVPVYAVGCGKIEGAPIPLRDDSGAVSGYKKDREGKVVTSRLEEQVMEQIALDTGGRYWRVSPDEIEVEQIAEGLAGLEGAEFGTQLRTRYEERFQLPLLVAWLALVAETLLGDRRRGAASARAAGREAA